MQDPDLQEGLDYWSALPATDDTVLGGFASGSMPRIDALGSRLFLLNLYPELCTVASSLKPLEAPQAAPRIRALDVGAGVGRVTCDVLLNLASDVVLVEPVESFVEEALARAQKSAAEKTNTWPGLADGSKSVTFLQGTLQEFHPRHPHRVRLLDRVGYQGSPLEADIGRGFDVIWCQWCLGHLSDADLVDFFKRARESLNGHPRSLIVVKENHCHDGEDGSPLVMFDEQDSSITRSDAAWKKAFADAGLNLLREETQRGFPEEIFGVKMYALR